MTNLFRLSSEQGQSPWLDNLKRSYLTSGELQRWIDKGIRGLTSNPTIFQKAIQGSSDYDAQFRDLVRARRSISESYWEMVVSDIRGALDVFAPLYASSRGGDGFVSVEVDPNLAHESGGTLQAGRELWQRIDRPNLMIKIPATVDGLPAIRSMIAEGRNVNVTLIFGLDRYQKVMEAYIDGLEDRVRAGGEPTGIASVASFFISRVDTEIDRRLDEVGTPEALALRGRAAVAQARLAYDAFTRTFGGPRWDSLKKAGAVAQRPLWASTSTKNPAYPDTLYVDELIGPDTVNTLPDTTVDSFIDHGRVARTIDAGVDEARATWSAIGRLVDLDDVAERLEREGVTAFQKSFDELLGALAAKSAEF
ncbi:MAG: transaldolase [Acidimicrobiales bacterium mtb01]|nr:transaldolase [Actinomycetota bacterium]TEX45186.1 MAG: transaldolase [Acidimicrobiales bacterium mtb01]